MLKHIHGDGRYHRSSIPLQHNSSIHQTSLHHHNTSHHHNRSHHHLNLNLSTSKHSLGGGTSSSGVSPSGGVHYNTSLHNGLIPNGGIHTPLTTTTPLTPNGNLHTYANGAIHSSPITPNGNISHHNFSHLHTSGITNKSIIRPPSAPMTIDTNTEQQYGNGIREMLTSLGLLCLISLLLAMLSLIFLLKISPVTAGEANVLRREQLTLISPDEYVVVYEVTLSLCALSLSLNLCCLLVCTVQFLFAVKLVRAAATQQQGDRPNEYLQKSSATGICAIGGLFVSIPIFLTGIILYTFIQFHSTPAIVTSGLIGVGIVFCGCAMVHNVYVWQKEKTNAVRHKIAQQRPAVAELSTLV